MELSAARRSSGAESALARPAANPCNGAREALIMWMEKTATIAPWFDEKLVAPTPREKAETVADALLCYLYVEGFKVVPLEDKDWRA